MVYSGKPSPGCANCRQVKKRCDQQLPCSRCARLGLTCGGYRDHSELVFHDESDKLAGRLEGSSSTSTRRKSPSLSTPTEPLSSDLDAVAKSLFFNQVVTETYLSFLEDATPDEFLLRPILACAFGVLANRNNNSVQARELATKHYVEAIAATNAALRHPRRVREDNTILAVYLLGVYELITHEGHRSSEAWSQHIKGASMCLQLRGRNYLKTRSGVALFRHLRADIALNALLREQSAPEYIGQWSQNLQYDSVHSAGDQLIVIASRVAALREMVHSPAGDYLFETANVLERDMMDWAQRALTEGGLSSFHDTDEPGTAHTWSGTRHESGMPPSYAHWDMFRFIRILLSRTQEALWRRSLPVAVQITGVVPFMGTYSAVRDRMVEDICMSSAYAFGDNNSLDPPIGSVASGLLLLNPLALAAMHLLEQLAPTTTSPGGTQTIVIDEPYHHNADIRPSRQLAWIIERIDYIAYKVGIRWAVALSRFLKGETAVRFNVERSMAVERQWMPMQEQDQILDFTNVIFVPDVEEEE